MVASSEHCVNQYAPEMPLVTKSVKKGKGLNLLNISLVLTFLAAIFKMSLLGLPSSVVYILLYLICRFDEVHFGGFTQHYLKGNFFLDVHPPFAKMAIAGLSWIFNLPKDYSFDLIGLDYLEADVPYIGLRVLPALLGTLLVPIMFWSCISIGLETEYAIFGALLILFENALTCQFRFIFLDAYLIFSSATAICCYLCFQNERKLPFSYKWWMYLIGTGIFLGLATSCKWVGLFTMATIGLSTFFDLWKLFSSPKLVSLSSFTFHFFARFGCLLIIPAFIYIGSFWIHFQILTKMGSGGTSMSILFQQTLDGGNLPYTHGSVGYGSIVILRHLTQKSYLHSHTHLYPEGSEQQQVTLYPYSDANNEWVIVPRHPDPYRTGHQWSNWPGNLSSVPSGPFVPVRDGDRIRLVHRLTHRILHSHVVDPPISNKEHHWEVSCYGLVDTFQSFGDTNDDWIIRITDRWGNNLYEDIDDSTYNGFRRRDQGKIEPIASQSIFELPIQYVKDKPESITEDDNSGPEPIIPDEESKSIVNDSHGIQSSEIETIEEASLTFEIVALEDVEKTSINHLEAVDLESKASSKVNADARNVSDFKEKNSSIYEDEKVPIVDNDKDPFSPITHAITARKTYIKLVHANTGCSLSSFGKSLPEWGFHQSEVTCGRDTLRSHSVLAIESNWHPLSMCITFKFTLLDLNNSDDNVMYDKLGFWESFLELHSLMWKMNKNLVAPHYYSSRPSTWPFLLRGLGFWSGLQGQSRNYTIVSDGNVRNTTWKHGSFIENDQMRTIHQNQQIHLIGNPLIWMGVTFSVFLYSLYIVITFLKSQRYSKMKRRLTSPLTLGTKQAIAFSAWFFHYIPFFFMGRQLYLHHYLTAYYFGIFLMTILIRTVLSKYFSVLWTRAILGVLSAITITIFAEFSPLTYGLPMSFERCERLRWFSSWDFDCSLLSSSIPPAPYIKQ